MARLRYNGLTTTLGASLTNSATSVTFAAGLTHSSGVAVPTISGGDYIPLTILDSAGAVSEVVHLTAYTSGATTGTIARGKESTSGAAHASGDKVVQAPTTADVLNGILAYKVYNPNTITTFSATGTLSDLDATNLKVSFVAPVNGTVLVTVNALAAITSGSGSTLYWSLRDDTTLATVGSPAQIINGAVSDLHRMRGQFVITGLTPGTTYTYRWSQKMASGKTGATYCGGVTDGYDVGNALMTVEALP